MQIYLFRDSLAIAYARSLSKAARAVPCAQSTLSRQVTRLESKLGVKLFERYGRQVEWTTTGEPPPPLMDGLVAVPFREPVSREFCLIFPWGRLLLAGARVLTLHVKRGVLHRGATL